MTSKPTTPIACDMTGAPDTAEERMAEYGRLFAQALIGRDRTDDTIRLRLRADDGVEDWVRDLAAREKACCPFLDIAVSTTTGGEVWWEASVVDGVADDDMARAILDDFYGLPETVDEGVAGMEGRFKERGFTVTTDASGSVMELHHGAGRPGLAGH